MYIGKSGVNVRADAVTVVDKAILNEQCNSSLLGVSMVNKRSILLTY